jgi:hypothetical protein
VQARFGVSLVSEAAAVPADESNVRSHAFSEVCSSTVAPVSRVVSLTRSYHTCIKQLGWHGWGLLAIRPVLFTCHDTSGLYWLCAHARAIVILQGKECSDRFVLLTSAFSVF